MAITNLPTELTSAGNTGTAGDYSSAGTSVFQISYANIGYVPSTTNVYENDFGAELRVFINGVRIYRLSSDTVGTDTSLTTAQKNRLDALNTSYGNQPWTIDSTNSRIQINKDHTVWGDTHTDNCGYPALSAWTIIKVVRIKSDKTTLTTDFQNASVLTEKQLDNAFLETFHIAQEAFDKTASGSLNKDTDDVWDANTTRIKNVSDPENDQDVATKAWVNSNANTTTVAGSIGNVNHVAGQISPTNNVSTVATSVTAGHIATVAGDSVDIGKVADIDGNVTKVADIDANVTKVANIDTNVTKVADIDDKVTTVAGKDTEVGLLGDAGVIEDMGHLGTSVNVTAMGHLGTSANVTAMGHLGTSTNVTNMANLNASGVISNIGTVATNVDNVNNFANTYFGAHANDTAVASHISTNSLTLGAGDLYYNTTSNSIESYNGSSWESMKTVVGGSTVTSADGSNLTLTTVADGENVVINSTTGTSGNTIVLPKVRASTNNYVLAMDDISTGSTEWQATATAPTLTGVSGELNTYENSAEDGGTLTLTGTDFGTDASAINSIKIMKSDGTNEVSASSFGTPTGTGIPNIVFNGSETGYNTFPADTTWYIQVTKSSLASDRFSSGKSFTKDPTISAITQSVASDDYNKQADGSDTFTGTNGHFGSYGGQVAGGGDDSNTKLLLNFDRGGGADIEDSSNTGGDGHKVTATNAVIKSSPFGDGKSAMRFDRASSSSGDYLTIPDSNDFNFGVDTLFTIELWANFSSVGTGYYDLFNFHSSTSYGLRLGWDDTGTNYWYFQGEGFTDDSTTLTETNGHDPVVGVWKHYCVQGDADNVRLYFDGVLKIEVARNTTSMDTDRDLLIGANSTSAGFFDGYMDEIRIVVGSKVYADAGFTVPTSRLTAITNTKLLIHSDQTYDSSDSNHHITTTGVIPKIDQSKWGGSSWYFDGSDDYLTVPYTTDFNLGTSSCVEFWWRSDGTSGSRTIISNGGIGTADVDGWSIAHGDNVNSNKFTVTVRTSSTNYTLISTTAVSSGTWYHVAWTRDGSTARLFVDGALEASSTAETHRSLTTNPDSKAMKVGVGHDNGLDATGWIDDLRIVNGSAVYTGAFSIPTGPLTTTGGTYPNSTNRTDPTASQTKLLIHGDGAKFTDSSTSDHDITPTGAYHSQGHGGIAPAMTWPASKKVTGSAGVYFGSSTGKLELASPPVLGTGAFTIEFWANPSSTQNGSANGDWYFLLDLRGGASQDIAPIVYMHKSNYQLRLTHGNSGSVLMSPSSDTALTLDTWQHLAFVREGTGSNQAKFYINGYLKATYTDATDWTATGSDFLGGNYNGDHAWNGYIDLYRHSNIARWTSAFNTDLPTQIYGAYGPENPSIGTIELTTATEDDVNVTYSFQGSTEDNASVLGSSSDLAIASDTTGANKKKGTLTGTLQGNAGSVTNLRIQAKANDDANRLVEVNETSGVGAVSFTKVSSGKPTLFSARRYHGTGSVRDINGFGFQPDFCWIKVRNEARSHMVWDSVTNLGDSPLVPDTTAQSQASAQGHISKFNQDGFSLASAGTDLNVNNDGDQYIAWAWKAGGAPVSISSGVSNLTDVTQSASSTTGFSITKYTGSGTTGYFPHNLGAKPDFLVVKRLTTSAGDWICWHKDLNSGNAGAGDYICLNGNAEKGQTSDGSNSADNFFASGITSTRIDIGGGFGAVNTSGEDYICYAFKPVEGVSAFGSHSGQISSVSGTTVGANGYCGFKPRFVMVKCISDNAGWNTWDSFRDPDTDDFLVANSDAVENTSNPSGLDVQMLANGFTTGTGEGVGGGSRDYISIAFA